MTLLGSKLAYRWTSRPRPQSLYSLTTVVPRVRASLGLTPTGAGTVGFEVDGDSLERTDAEIVAANAGRTSVHPLVTQDLHGRCTVRCWRRNGDLRVLAGDLVGVADRLARAGYGGSLRYATVEFAEPTGRRTPMLQLVYLFDRGTYYPMTPAWPCARDRVLELRARAALNGTLPLEPERGRCP